MRINWNDLPPTNGRRGDTFELLCRDLLAALQFEGPQLQGPATASDLGTDIQALWRPRDPDGEVAEDRPPEDWFVQAKFRDKAGGLRRSELADSVCSAAARVGSNPAVVLFMTNAQIPQVSKDFLRALADRLQVRLRFWEGDKMERLLGQHGEVLAKYFLSGLIEGEVPRTQAIVNECQRLLEGPPLGPDYIIRLQGYAACFAISDDEEGYKEDYYRLLKGERDKVTALVEKGASCRCIISPMFYLARYRMSERPNIPRRLKRLKCFLDDHVQDKGFVQRCQFVCSPSTRGSLHILGTDALFEGYKTRTGHGYGLTFFSREKNMIEAEIEAFDRIFDDTRERLLADRPSDSTLKMIPNGSGSAPRRR